MTVNYPRCFHGNFGKTRPAGSSSLPRLVILFILFFDLSGIAMMGSGAFLLIYACVHAAHLRVAHETGGNKWIVSLSLVTCLAMLAVLTVYIYENSRFALITMIVLIPICLCAELAYRRATGRTIRTEEVAVYRLLLSFGKKRAGGSLSGQRGPALHSPH